MDSSSTKVNTPMDMVKALEVDDEDFYATRKGMKNLNL